MGGITITGASKKTRRIHRCISPSRVRRWEVYKRGREEPQGSGGKVPQVGKKGKKIPAGDIMMQRGELECIAKVRREREGSRRTAKNKGEDIEAKNQGERG